jgi:LmbE family N-acetylglucosaminyl deacetylase
MRALPLVLCITFGVGPAWAAAPTPMGPITAADSLLVIAPHPDDETLCCGGTISLARRAGARVTIVWVTSGDGSRAAAILARHALWPRRSVYRNLGVRRAEEARHAAKILGVDADSLYFLGYPDTGIRMLAGAHFDSPLRSRRTGLSVVTQPDALSAGASYEGRNVIGDLLEILALTKPTLVLAPSSLDTHPDHQGVAVLAVRAVAEYGELDRLYLWIVHGGRGWPAPRRPAPWVDERVPTSGRDLEWSFVLLDPLAVEEKDSALHAHASARRVMARKMNGFVRATELFSRFTPAGDPAIGQNCRPRTCPTGELR